MKSDVIVIGSGAAGMMCAMCAGQRGRSVVLLDHSRKLAEKIRISGGGRCNFTNIHTSHENFISENPDFCRSALARFTPQDFIAMLQRHNISYHEKKLGQLFCDLDSNAIISMLREECEHAAVKRFMGCEVDEVSYSPAVAENRERHPWHRFHITTSMGDFNSASLVIGTGGLSIPKAGATPFGYQIAEQFGVPVTKVRPGLVPLTFSPDTWKAYAGLAGVSFGVTATCGDQSFTEDMLITHCGLSGPAILQISSYWRHGMPLHVDLLPGIDVKMMFYQDRTSRKLLSNYLSNWLPRSFSEIWCSELARQTGIEIRPLAQYSEREHAQIIDHLQDWQITPSGTAGYGKAEVTCGGIDTRALSSRTMECIEVPGLYFIGEVVDVTGQLGGYNLQWAWSSGYAAGQSV
jgi:predicted Rossmann fold flavoprotein